MADNHPSSSFQSLVDNLPSASVSAPVTDDLQQANQSSQPVQNHSKIINDLLTKFNESLKKSRFSTNK
jgi:hypothetical protein